MVRKLRKKFVLVLMGITTTFLVILLGGLYLFTAANYERSSVELLNSALRNGPQTRGNVPFAVLDLNADGTCLVQVNHIYHLSDQTLEELARSIDLRGRGTGTASALDLRYSYQTMGGRGRLALVDMRFEQDALRSLALNSLLIGLAAFLGLFGVSILLSRWMVRPVEKAWNHQRQFVADASHELKTPLTAALSNLDMTLSTSPEQLSEKNQRRLSIAKLELQRMKGLTEKLLVIARADAAKDVAISRGRWHTVDLSYLFTCAAASFETVAFDAGRTLISDITPHCTFTGDPERLRELVDILLDNACKYSLPGSEILLRLDREKKWIHLQVSNQTEPIGKEDLTRIFQRFYRVDQSRGEVRGFGLGLPIAREIVQQHKGTIWAQSKDENWIVFHVKLPPQDKNRPGA